MEKVLQEFDERNRDITVNVGGRLTHQPPAPARHRAAITAHSATPGAPVHWQAAMPASDAG